MGALVFGYWHQKNASRGIIPNKMRVLRKAPGSVVNWAKGGHYTPGSDEHGSGPKF